MAGELDSRLISLLKATLGLVDALRDMGGAERVAVRLDRAAGLTLRQLTGARVGNSIGLAGVTFEWPQAMQLEDMAANDNLALRRGDETPARR